MGNLSIALIVLSNRVVAIDRSLNVIHCCWLLVLVGNGLSRMEGSGDRSQSAGQSDRFTDQDEGSGAVEQRGNHSNIREISERQIQRRLETHSRIDGHE